MPKANRPQAQFLAMPQKFKAFVAGFGSGKTWVGCMSMCTHFWEHPKVRQGYFAPSYPQIRDIYYPTIEEVAYDMGLRADIKTGDKEVHFYSGRAYRGTTICRSMDNPGSIVGFKIGHALVDELDVMARQKAEHAWRKIIARMRHKEAGVINGIDVTTTPEGFKFTYEMFKQLPANKPALQSMYGLIQASTYDNEKNLPDDYIDSLFDTYPSQLISAYLNGQFVNLTSGTVYHNYNRERCRSTETIKDGEPLFIGQDFNVGKMASTIYVKRSNGWHAVAELSDLFDTPDVIRVIQERWQNAGHRIIMYPDASGKNRKSNNASTSDLALLEQAGFEVRNNASNPAVKDRVLSMNKALESSKVWVNDKACPSTARCLEQQAYDKNGEPDKSNDNDHQNDATTYPIAYEMPVVKPLAQIKVNMWGR